MEEWKTASMDGRTAIGQANLRSLLDGAGPDALCTDLHAPDGALVEDADPLDIRLEGPSADAGRLLADAALALRAAASGDTAAEVGPLPAHFTYSGHGGTVS